MSEVNRILSVSYSSMFGLRVRIRRRDVSSVNFVHFVKRSFCTLSRDGRFNLFFYLSISSMLASGRPVFWSEVAAKDVVAWGLMLCGLLLSIWTIVYMKRRGKGNPMDAFGHEVAPRTQHLMTDGPYRLNRNPMLTGTLIYLIGFALWLYSWQAVIVWLLFFAIMFILVLSEERRLHRDFGNEYDVYCRHTRRF